MNAGLRFDHDGLSHQGRIRTNNEDAFCIRGDDGLYVVADGMGGHENGEWASAAIVDALRAVALPADFDAAWAVVAETLHAANATIWNEAESRGLQMGSTVVVLLLRGLRFAVLWVGDSRIYLSRQAMLVQLTHDHTQVQEMLDRGLLTPDQAEGHPMSHVLARAVGVRPSVEVDIVSDTIEIGDVFLLCSDGLTARVTDPEINAVIASPEPIDRSLTLVDLTLARGAPDNVTVITVRAHQPTLLSFLQPLPTVTMS